MGNDTSSVIISLCAVSAVVFALILLAGFLMVRVMRMSIFGVSRMVLNTLTDPKEEPSQLDARAQFVRPQRRDLRALAKSIDFDEAVARHGGDPNVRTQSTSTNPITNQSLPPTSEPTDNFPSAAARARRRRRLSEAQDDGILDHFMDDGDDGLI